MRRQLRSDGQTLVITPGPPQLLLQLAVLQAKGLVGNTLVVSCSHLFGPELRDALIEACLGFGVKYAGNLTPPNYQGFDPSSEQFVNRLDWRLRPHVYCRHILQKCGWSTGWKFKRLVVSLRPFLFDDLLFYEAVRPAECICVIDGISVKSPSRTLEGAKWSSLNAPFRDLPCNSSVFAPKYLLKYAAELGIAEEIPAESIGGVYDAYLDFPSTRRIAACVEYSSRNAILISQHLSLSGHCTLGEEVKFYGRVVEREVHLGAERVLFKPHPRDQKDKLSGINDLISQYPQLSVVPTDLQAVALEPLYRHMSAERFSSVSCNSTAVLSFRAISGGAVRAYCGNELSPDFRAEVKYFAAKNSVDLAVLD